MTNLSNRFNREKLLEKLEKNLKCSGLTKTDVRIIKWICLEQACSIGVIHKSPYQAYFFRGIEHEGLRDFAKLKHLEMWTPRVKIS